MLETEPVGYVSRLHQFPALQLALRLCRCDDDGLAKYVKRLPANRRVSCGAHPSVLGGGVRLRGGGARRPGSRGVRVRGLAGRGSGGCVRDPAAGG
jgi:hypothetical protein